MMGAATDAVVYSGEARLFKLLVPKASTGVVIGKKGANITSLSTEVRPTAWLSFRDIVSVGACRMPHGGCGSRSAYLTGEFGIWGRASGHTDGCEGSAVSKQ